MKNKNKPNLKVIGDSSVNIDIPKEENNYYRVPPLLAEYGLEVLQFIAQDNDLFHSDVLMFVNKHTRTASVVDCTRAIQILRANGIGVHAAQIRVIIEYDILEDPVGEIIFEAC